MNYIGSKRKLVSWIEDEIKSFAGEDLSEKIFCDMFAGTGTIGRRFKPQVKKLIANDLEHYSYILNKNYIQNSATLKSKQERIEELNALDVQENGFIYKHYALGSGSKRQYFSDMNAKKIDTIRQKIQEWYIKKEIDEQMYTFLLASLLESADKVANTASVYGSFLKELKPSAKELLVLEAADFSSHTQEHSVFNKDANILVDDICGDILYIDPPYNQRQYGLYYHMLNTITRYDNFEPQGKTGLRTYTRSNYCKTKEVYDSFEALIENADFEYIFVSYSSEGHMSKEEIKNIMQKYGTYSVQTKEHQRFDVGTTFEYLHVIKKER